MTAQCSAVVPSGCAALTSAAALHQCAQRADVLLLRRVGRVRAGGMADCRRDHRKKNGQQRQRSAGADIVYSCESPVYTSDSNPVLSPTLSCGMPALSRIVSSRFAIGVFSGYLR